MAKPLSVQLYTVRDHLVEDPRGTLERLADIGFTQVEPFGLPSWAERLAVELPRLGLIAPTAHARLVDDEIPWEETFKAAQALGVETVIDPKTDATRWQNRESVLELAHVFTERARCAADWGLRVGYHNHAFELQSRISGVPALEVFADAVGPHIDLEVDTYWAEVGGASAPELLRRLSGQVTALHLKDGPKTSVKRDQVAVGQGLMPIREIISVAPDALPVIELDDYAGNVFDAVSTSREFLRLSR